MSIRFHLMLISCFILGSISAQNISYLKIVTQNQFDKPISGVSIRLNRSDEIMVTGKDASFTFLVENGPIFIELFGVGLIPVEKTIEIQKDTIITFSMYERYTILEDVEIQSSKINPKVDIENANIERIEPTQAKDLGYFGGEQDIIRAISFQPGVNAFSEARSEISVRGGLPGQNQYLFNGMQIYPVGHFLGLISPINPNAIDQVSFYKSAFPAKYGSRVASVIDISSDEIIDTLFRARFSVSNLSTNASVKIPVNNRIHISTGLRNSITELYKSFTDVELSFYDVYARALYSDEKSKLSVNFYRSNDYDEELIPKSFDQFELFGNQIINNAVGLNFDHVFSKSFKFGFNAYQSNFSRTRIFEFDELENYDLSTSLRETSAKANFTLKSQPGPNYEFGVQFDNISVSPFELILNDSLLQEEINNLYGIHPYFETNFSFATIDFRVGLRNSNYFYQGSTSDAVLEPRLMLHKVFNQEHSLTMDYSRMSQPVSLLTNSSFGLPNDTWILNSNTTISDQITFTYNGGREAFNTNLFWGAGIYIRNNQFIYDYLDGGDIINLFTQVDDEPGDLNTIIGEGENITYGVELELKKPFGRLETFANYTFASSTNTISAINNGDAYPSPLDINHVLTSSVSYQFNRKWRSTLNFLFQSGRPYTRPSSFVNFSNFSNAGFGFTGGPIQIYQYAGRNNGRMIPYHRLDVVVERKFAFRNYPKITGSYIFSVYNAYNRANPFYYVLDNTTITSVSILPIVPSFSIHFNLN